MADAQHRLSGVDSTQILGAVRAVVNEAAGSLRDLREWCDKTEARLGEEPVCCDVCASRQEAWTKAVEQVRGLLPPIHESGSPDP